MLINKQYFQIEMKIEKPKVWVLAAPQLSCICLDRKQHMHWVCHNKTNDVSYIITVLEIVSFDCIFYFSSGILQVTS